MTSPGGSPAGPAGYGGPSGSAGSSQSGGSALTSEVQTLERAIFEVKRIIVGQDQLVERILVGLLAKGHVLLEGVPGVAKTLAVETFARVVGGTFARIQFTPDLVPTDIIGTRIYRQGREEFDIEFGPVMCNFLLADEINRAPAKVQSALLEVMAERKISIGGRDYPPAAIPLRTGRHGGDFRLPAAFNRPGGCGGHQGRYRTGAEDLPAVICEDADLYGGPELWIVHGSGPFPFSGVLKDVRNSFLKYVKLFS